MNNKSAVYDYYMRSDGTFLLRVVKRITEQTH